MLIGIDARMYGEKVTGIGNYVKDLTDSLFKIDQENNYVLFMLDYAYRDFIPPNPRIKKVLVDSYWYTFSEQRKFFRELEREKTDMMHFPNFNVPLFFTRDFVVTIHDITTKFFPGPKVAGSIFRRWAYEVVFRSGIKRAVKIITVSDHSKKNILSHYKIPSDKINVIYNGMSPSFHRVEDCGIINELKSRFNIKTPFVFYTGVLRPHKNIPNLIRAFEILLNKYKKQLTLVIGGDAKNEDKAIVAAIKELKLEKNIIKTGFIAKDDLKKFYSAAEITVIPSFCEGFGFIGLESLACKTPVVASNTTSLPEILGPAALYFDPGNPREIAGVIKQVIEQKSLSEKLINIGLARIKKYNWAIAAKQTLDLYKEAYKSKRN